MSIMVALSEPVVIYLNILYLSLIEVDVSCFYIPFSHLNHSIDVFMELQCFGLKTSLS